LKFRSFLESSELLLHVLLDGVHEVLGVKEHSLLDVLQAVDAAGQVLGHVTVVDGVDASGLEGQAKPEKQKWFSNC